jgi:putative flippase GtrA
VSASELAYRFGAAARQSATWVQLLKFGLVGASGYLINLGAGDGPAHFQAARFFAVSLAALGLNLAVLEVLVSSGGVGELSAQAIAVAVAMPFNFLGNKLWTFA